jgi:hypothetical protein
MDRWGADGCEEPENFAEIVKYMVLQFNERRLSLAGISKTARAFLRVTPKSAGPMLAKRLVKRAIRVSRKRLKKQKEGLDING